MKKINAMLVLMFVAVFAMNAQTFFNAVNWVNWGNKDFTEAYNKKSYQLKKAPEEWVFDNTDVNFDFFWSVLQTEEIKNLTSNGVAGNLYGDKFGAKWGAFYNDDAVYVIFKYIDDDSQVDEGSRSFEVMVQSNYPDGYTPGIEAATEVADKNKQHARQTRLGGGKALLKSTGVSEYAASTGLTDGWGPNPAAGNFTADNSAWVVDGTTIWAALELRYDDHLFYLEDPFGALEAANYVTYVPEVGKKISFDVKSNSLKGGTANDNKIEYFWNSLENDGYAAVYYSGYIEFTDLPLLTSVKGVSAKNVSAYISNDILKFKGLEIAKEVEIFTVLGQRVKSARNVSELNLSDLKGGMYVVKVKEVGSFKIVK